MTDSLFGPDIVLLLVNAIVNFVDAHAFKGIKACQHLIAAPRESSHRKICKEA